MSSIPYPPSVIVSETILIAGSARRAITASGSSGANRYSTIEPTTRASSSPLACFSTSVYRQSCASRARCISRSAVEDADAADSPVVGQPGVHQSVEIHRLMRTVKAADAEMDDARR